MATYPTRSNSHVLEQKSENFLRMNVPAEWTIQRIEKDYGQDFLVEISENGEMRGLGLVIQLKSSEKGQGEKQNESIILKRSTFNYLKEILPVVMLVKYVEEKDEAFWILLKDVFPDFKNEDQQTFTVQLPFQNKLSEMNWASIVTYVKKISDVKQVAALKWRLEQIQK